MAENLKSIAFVTVWFGKFRNDMELWLQSCLLNPTVDWIIFTDNTEEYDYPLNVHIYHTTFEEIKNRFQNLYDFPISLKTIRRLCDFKVAYGEAFEKELSNYDFWGYCDLDMIFGDIRSFLTEKILSEYEKIGFVGNCTLYHNTVENNRRYRSSIRGNELYKKYFSNEGSYCFDEVGINDIYIKAGIAIYKEVNFSDLASNCYGLKQCFLSSKDRYQNKNVIYMWDKGKLYHIYIHQGCVKRKEVMFVHFLGFRKFKIELEEKCDAFLITPGKIISYEELTLRKVKKYARSHWISYVVKELYKRKNLGSMKGWLHTFLEYHYWLYFHSGVYNYWVWTNYEQDKKERMYLLEKN